MAEDKLSWSELRHTLAQRAGVTEKVANTFLNALNAQLVEALKQDKQVKINGLGTFRLQAVAPRKSVNVTTGEAITIEGYNKITFSAEAGVKELIEGHKPFQPIAKEETNTPAPENTPIDPLKKLSAQADEIIDILADLGQAPSEDKKAEEPKIEEPKAEEPKVEEPIVEEPKIEEPKVEEPVVEEPKVEETKIEEPKAEEPAVVPEFPNIQEPEDTKEEDIIIRPVIVKHVEPVIGRGFDSVSEKPAEPVVEKPAEPVAPTIPSTPSTPVTPTVQPTPSTPSTPTYQAPTYQTPTYQAPTYQAPKYEAPKYEAPKPTASKPAAPKQEEPKKKESHFFRSLLIWLLLIALLLLGGYYILRYYGKSGWIDAYLYHTDNTTVVLPADTIVATDTIVAEPEPIESESNADQMQFEKIKYRYIKTERMHWGSRLIWMSKRYYGDKAYWPYLYDANRDRITNPDQIEVGTPIRVPKLTRELRDTTVEHTRLRLRALRREAEEACKK